MTQGRIVHRDRRLYVTPHVVFAPALMSAEAQQSGYEWGYRRLSSRAGSGARSSS